MNTYRSSIERLEKELGFKPDYTFEQGIKETTEEENYDELINQ